MRTVSSLLVSAALTSSLFAPAFGQQDPAPQSARVAMVEISHSPADAPGPLDWLFPAKDPTLQQLVDGLTEMSKSHEYEAVVLRLKDADIHATQVEELGSAIKALRAAGVKVYVFGEALGSSDLMLGSFADSIICQRGGDVQFMGMHMEEMYLADAFAWVGLKADMIQVGAFKGANEEMVNSKPSPEWDANINQLLDSLYANLRAPIMKGRDMNAARMDAAMSKLWMAQAEDAKDLGLIDDAIDFTALTSHISDQLKSPITWELDPIRDDSVSAPDFSNPFGAIAALAREPDVTPTEPSIAVLHIDGPIVDGDSSMGGFSGEASVGSRTVRNAIEDMLAEDLIKGVVVRIDSPGGSATASEVIWQGLRRLAEKKRVWVSVGSMAASGGYYLAVGGDRIYVNPSSIVGSIGVVGGKISMTGLYEKLKINVVSRSRGPHGDLFGSQPWDEVQQKLVREKMTATYDKFTSRVRSGRKGIDLNAVAAGRLFTGDKAVENKLADRIGGLAEAVGDLAADLSLTEYGVVHYPAPRSLPHVIEDFLGGVSASSPLAGRVARSATQAELAEIARQIVGPHAWPQISRQLDAMMQLREEPVLLMSPKAIIIR